MSSLFFSLSLLISFSFVTKAEIHSNNTELYPPGVTTGWDTAEYTYNTPITWLTWGVVNSQGGIVITAFEGEYFTETLGTAEIETPCPSVNLTEKDEQITGVQIYGGKQSLQLNIIIFLKFFWF